MMNHQKLKSGHRNHCQVGLPHRVEDMVELRVSLEYKERMSATLIEEYSEKKRVERFLKQHPYWKPEILYICLEDDMQTGQKKTSMSEIEAFLKKHNTSICHFSMMDYEETAFANKYSHLKCARRIKARNEFADKLLALSHEMKLGNISDSPWIFHYLTPERMVELKTQMNQRFREEIASVNSADEINDVKAYYKGMFYRLDHCHEFYQKELVPGGISIGVDITEQVRSNVVSYPQSQSVPQRKTSVIDDVMGASNTILNFAVDKQTDDINTLKDAIEIMTGSSSELKKMKPKAKNRCVRFIRAAIAQMETLVGDNAVANSIKKVFRKGITSLNNVVLTNGEKEIVKRQQKMEKGIKEKESTKKLVAHNLKKQEKLKQRALAERKADLERIASLSPEELAHREAEKEARRVLARERKIAKAKRMAQLAQMPKEEPVIQETVVEEVKKEEVVENINQPSPFEKTTERAREQLVNKMTKKEDPFAQFLAKEKQPKRVPQVRPVYNDHRKSAIGKSLFIHSR